MESFSVSFGKHICSNQSSFKRAQEQGWDREEGSAREEGGGKN